jgi:hypothetical protein
MLTLFTTPVIYLYLDSVSLWWARVWKRERKAAGILPADSSSEIVD